MKKSIRTVIFFTALTISLASCHRDDLSITINEDGNNMRIIIKDNNGDNALDFAKDYDITGMDSTQKKAVTRRVLDSLGHGRYKTD